MSYALRTKEARRGVWLSRKVIPAIPLFVPGDPAVLATSHIRPLNRALKSTFTCLSQLADSPEEEENRNAFICSSSQRGHVHCAWDSHLHHAVNKPLPSVAPTPLQRLDETVHHFSLVGVAGRPSQKHVRTDGRKRPPPSATHHPPSARETTHLYQNGSAAPGTPGKSRSDLETSAVDCSARDAPAVASPGMRACFGNTSPEQGLLNRRLLKKLWP
jgi:hypothetical protein